MTTPKTDREIGLGHLYDPEGDYDPLIEKFIREGKPVTREAYIAYNWPDDPPEGDDLEEALPAFLRLSGPSQAP